MAGHSHWHNIQQAKGKADSKRGVLFTKAAQQIIMTSRESGGDPNQNLSLRIAVDYARSVNMPKENIERAIKKGSGDLGALRLEKAVYEGYGPGKIPIIIATITDNKNRTVNELRSIFTKASGELGTIGTVAWQFSEFGRIIVRSVKIKKGEKFGEGDMEIPVDREIAMLELMDVPEAEDIESDQDSSDLLFVQAPLTRLAQVGQAIREKGYVIVSSGQHFEPHTKIELPEEMQEVFAAFLDTLEDYQDVQQIWHAAL